MIDVLLQMLHARHAKGAMRMGPHVTEVNFASCPELAIFAECRCGWTGVRRSGNPFEPNADEIALQLASREAARHEACNRHPGRYVADHVA